MKLCVLLVFIWLCLYLGPNASVFIWFLMALSLSGFSVTSYHLICKNNLEVVLVRVSIAVANKHGQKADWRGKGLFGLHFQIIVHY